jgi:hypothetical protein
MALAFIVFPRFPLQQTNLITDCLTPPFDDDSAMAFNRRKMEDQLCAKPAQPLPPHSANAQVLAM